jgi:hypothetical protein
MNVHNKIEKIIPKELDKMKIPKESPHGKIEYLAGSV